MAIEQAKIIMDLYRIGTEKRVLSTLFFLPIYRKISWIVSILKNDNVIVCIV